MRYTCTAILIQLLGYYKILFGFQEASFGLLIIIVCHFHH